MKIHAFIRRICGKCPPIRRWNQVMIICSISRHNKKQG